MTNAIRTSAVGLLAVLVTCGALADPARGCDGVLYVDDDAPPAGDGTSWETAYRFLQDALAAAAGSAGDIEQIWIGGGHYLPDRDEANPDGTGDRESTFQLLSGVTVRGGHLGLAAGEGENPNARDLVLHATTLSGDLLGDDEPEFVNYGDNSRHVVTANGVDATAMLDGVVVVSGNADDSVFARGGGLLNEDGDPTLVDCGFEANVAIHRGGGMYVGVGGARLLRCWFMGNLADARTTFSFAEGGGLLNLRGDVRLVGCRFEGNRAIDPAMAAGGGLVGGATASTTVLNCVVVNNFADSDEDASGGGALMAAGSMTNCLFAGNAARSAKLGLGGAVIAKQLDMYNCTLVDNHADHRGGGVYVLGGESLTVSNSILWDNTDPRGGEAAQIDVADHTGPLGVAYSCIQRLTGDLGGVGNIGDDPLFVDPGADDYRLSASSPCVDAADNGLVDDCSVELDGRERRVDDPDVPDTGAGEAPIVDMGVYERLGPPADCNVNARVDTCDIDGGLSEDVNGNGTPDECEERPCPEDLDGSGAVDFADILVLLTAWGDAGGPEDLDGSGCVDFGDILLVLSNWGPC